MDWSGNLVDLVLSRAVHLDGSCEHRGHLGIKTRAFATRHAPCQGLSDDILPPVLRLVLQFNDEEDGVADGVELWTR